MRTRSLITSTARRTSHLHRARLVVPAAAFAVVASLLAGHGPARPLASGPATSSASSSATGSTGVSGSGASGARIALAAVNRVELKRHRGFIQGDGQTVYVANRTEFRPRRTSVALPPQVRARSWVVVDLDSGRLLGSHNARTWLPQASTMKLLTAITALRTIRPGTTYRVTRYDTSQTCTCAGLKRGRYYSRNTLLKGMLLPSGNDAAEALAGAHPGGRRAFYRAMNDVARQLGATDTVAKNASGLTAPGSHSSARDLVLLLREALRQPALVRILGSRSAVIATVAGRARHTVWRATDYVNRYPNSLGKSGYTTPALNTLVVETEIDGHRIAVASLGAPGGYSTSGARALTEWANTDFDGLKDVGRLPLS